MAPPTKERPRTRIQREKQDVILNAARDVFSLHGFRGATIDQIAEAAGMSKPNLLYYFASKEEIHRRLLEDMLDLWLDPISELRSYIRRKLEMARDFPRESRLFANEMLQGAPHAIDVLEGELKVRDADKARENEAWIEDGRITRTDPYH